ncbi:MAG: Nitroreductase family protein [Phenylobacterium sp.]|nr:Nitroreductase family protein [Phenylobacterium sp.]
MALTINGRTAGHDIDPQFLERWSPRAFSPEPIPDETLMTIFEAARWAPSCFNAQPWRFLYARRDTEHWLRFFDLLIPMNQAWAKNASVLGVVVSHTLLEIPGRDPMPAHSHSYDAGAAWMSLALQARELGWAAHGMMGFDVARAAIELHVPEHHRVDAAFAIGRPTTPDVLPEALAAREVPSGRNPLEAMLFEGGFPKP